MDINQDFQQKSFYWRLDEHCFIHNNISASLYVFILCSCRPRRQHCRSSALSCVRSLSTCSLPIPYRISIDRKSMVLFDLFHYWCFSAIVVVVNQARSILFTSFHFLIAIRLPFAISCCLYSYRIHRLRKTFHFEHLSSVSACFVDIMLLVRFVLSNHLSLIDHIAIANWTAFTAAHKWINNNANGYSTKQIVIRAVRFSTTKILPV